MLAVVVGFVSVCLLYAVPIVGLMTWALVGVLGLGSATLTVMAALRRERAKRRPKTEPPPAPADSGVDRDVPPAAPVIPAAPMMASAGPPPSYEPPPMAPPPAYEPPPMSAPAMAATTGGAAVALPGIGRATFLDRVVAGALDLLFVAFVYNMFFDRYWRGADGASMLFFAFAYFVTFWAWKSTTLGGMVCNLRIVRMNGTPLTGADAVVRGLASVFSFVPLGLGFFWILKDPERQAWHDKIAGTLVIKDTSGS
jgi:uncharacterized RDD family membrane protein YckC